VGQEAELLGMEYASLVSRGSSLTSVVFCMKCQFRLLNILDSCFSVAQLMVSFIAACVARIVEDVYLMVLAAFLIVVHVLPLLVFHILLFSVFCCVLTHLINFVLSSVHG